MILLPEAAGDVTRFLASLKTSLASKVLRRWRVLNAPILSRVRDSAGEPHFWQPGGGYDRCVVGDELFEKIAYCHRNPITRGLALTSVEWPWSSARAYESRPDYAGPPINFEDLPRTGRCLT